MGHVKLADVQRILGIHATLPTHPHCKTREELLEFTVDGVKGQAVVTHSWRSESIKLVEPFTVDGSAYGFGFEPPLFVLNASFSARNTTLKVAGLTLHDYWLKNAQMLFRLHSSFIKYKPKIEHEQKQCLKKIGDELAMAQYKSIIANEQFRLCRNTLRQRLHEGTISPRDYQQNLATFRVEAKNCLSAFHSLQSDVNRQLEKIKMTFINLALAGG